MRRDLRAHEHEHPIPVAGERPGRVRVVVGDDEKGQARLAARPHDIFRGARTVRERGVNVHHAGDPRQSIARRLTFQGQRLPQQGHADPQRHRYHDRRHHEQPQSMPATHPLTLSCVSPSLAAR